MKILIAALLIAMIGLGAGVQAQTILSSSIMEQTTLDATAPCSFCAHWRYSRATQTLYRWNTVAEEWQAFSPNNAGSGLTYNAGSIDLGGTVDQNTSIDASTFDFEIIADELSLSSASINLGSLPSTNTDINLPDATVRFLGADDIRIPTGSRFFVQNDLLTFNKGLAIDLNNITELTTINLQASFSKEGYLLLGATSQGAPPANGYLGYNTTSGALAIYDGSWTDIGSGGGGSAFWEDASGTVRTVSSSAGLDFVFGSSSTEDTGNSTEDHRMFFDNSKGALYAGEWTSTQANDVNRGFNSINLSRNSITSGYTSASIGGENNDIDGSGSVAVACDDCISDGSSGNSVLTGKDARSTLENDHVHGGGGDFQLGHHQYRRLIAWKDHSGTGTATLHLNGTNADLVIPNNTIWAGQCECSAIVKTAGTGTSVGDHKFYQGRFTAKNIAGSVSFGNVQFVNTTDGLMDSSSFDSSSLNMVNDDTNNALTIQITNIPGSVTSITHITCTLHITETGY